MNTLLIVLSVKAWLVCGLLVWHRVSGGWKSCDAFDAFMVGPCMIGGPVLLLFYVATEFRRKPKRPKSIWHVDRDGRVRTDKDRPVELRARKQ